MNDLLKRLDQRGLSLYLQDQKLRFKGPKGALTEHLREEIRANKEDLIVWLSKDQDPGAHHPLSSAQRRIWVLSKMDESGTLYNVPLSFILKGELDRRALEAALNELIKRHETLRTSIEEDRGEPQGHVWDILDFQLDYEDWREHPNQETALKKLAEHEEHAVFDLHKPPLLRARLIRMAEQEHALFICMHHIIADGWSISLFMKEVSLYYLHHCGQSVQLPTPLPIQYRHFAAREDYYLGHMDSHRDYWHNKLAAPLPVMELPRDNRRPKLQSYSGAEYRFSLHGELGVDFHHLAMKHRGGVFITFLALLKVLLLRYTQESDIIVGTPIGGRPHMDLEHLIGCFLNTLALRDQLDPRDTFIEALGRVRQTATEAYDHQSYPFEQLVNELPIERDLSRAPLFDVMVVSQTDRDLSAELGSLSLTPNFKPASISKFDMTFHISTEEGGLGIAIEYNRDLFSPKRIKHLAGYLETLLDGIIKNPNQGIGTYPLLKPEARKALLLEGEPNRAGGLTLLDRFQRSVLHGPNRIAIQVARENSTITPQYRTYADLNEDANRIAAHLIHRGIGPGHLVGICVTRSINLLAGLLGILKSGAAYVPMDPTFPADRLAYMREHAQTPVILVDKSTRGLMDDPKRLDLDDLVNSIPEPAPISKPSGIQPAYTIYTSGSTGTPKGVMISHAALSNFLCAMEKEPGLYKEDRLLAVTSLSFDIAALELYLPLITGARVLLASSAMSGDATRLIKALRTEKITCMQATPMTWRMLVEHDVDVLNKLKVWCGGEALPLDLAQVFATNAKQAYNLYGPTETTVWSARQELTDPHSKQVAIGRPIEATGLYVLDPHLEPVTPGTPGELFIGGDGLAMGYPGRPAQTALKFVPNPFATEPTTSGSRLYRSGDLSRIDGDENGTYQIAFLGRNDGQIKLRGYRIELPEIEALLSKIKGITQAIVLLKGDSDNARLLAFIQVEPDGPDTQQMRTHLSAHLPAYMLPSAFHLVEEWPTTPNGKIDRKRLLQQAKSAPQGPSFEPASGPCEEKIAAVWASVLKLEKAGRTSHFFEEGGNSLTAARAVYELGQVQEAPVSLIDLFQAPTVKEMAALLSTRSGTQHSSQAQVFNLDTEAYQLVEAADSPPLFNAAQLESLYEQGS